jgi:hypothetical protein
MCPGTQCGFQVIGTATVATWAHMSTHYYSLHAHCYCCKVPSPPASCTRRGGCHLESGVDLLLMHAMMAPMPSEIRRQYTAHTVWASCPVVALWQQGSASRQYRLADIRTIVFCPSNWHAPALPLLSWHAAGYTAGQQTHACSTA